MCGLGQIQSPRACPQSSLGRPGPGRLASSSRRSPAPCRLVPIPGPASSRTAGSGIKPIPGPDRRLRLALWPARSGASGHGGGGLGAEGKEAAAGAAQPEAAAFCGAKLRSPPPGPGTFLELPSQTAMPCSGTSPHHFQATECYVISHILEITSFAAWPLFRPFIPVPKAPALL